MPSPCMKGGDSRALPPSVSIQALSEGPDLIPLRALVCVTKGAI